MKLSYEEILGIAKSISAEAENMNGVLNDIKKYFDQIGEGSNCFRGVAANNVKTQFETVTATFPEFVKAVEDESTFVNTAVANYQSVDSEVTSKSNIGGN